VRWVAIGASTDTGADCCNWPVLAAAGLGVMLCFFGVSALNVVLPQLASDLGASTTQARWILLSYMLVSSVCILSLGRLADLWGRRRLFLGGLAAFIVASAACAMASSASALLSARVMQAIGAAGVIATASAIVSDAFGRSRLGLALGILAMIAALAQVAGPTLGGLLVSSFGWRSLFALNVPLGSIALIGAWFVVPERPGGSSWNFDLAGAAWSVVGLGGVAYALSVASAAGWLSLQVLAPLSIGMLAIAAFVHTQRTSVGPLIDRAD
jgi:MFS family permease